MPTIQELKQFSFGPDDELLCYEIWQEDEPAKSEDNPSAPIASYWDVQTAWRVAKAMNDPRVSNGKVYGVIVANGNEIDIVTGERRERSDVL